MSINRKSIRWADPLFPDGYRWRSHKKWCECGLSSSSIYCHDMTIVLHLIQGMRSCTCQPKRYCPGSVSCHSYPQVDLGISGCKNGKSMWGKGVGWGGIAPAGYPVCKMDQSHPFYFICTSSITRSGAVLRRRSFWRIRLPPECYTMVNP